jgi:succinyl-CoA synthetase alpha subunit
MTLVNSALPAGKAIGKVGIITLEVMQHGKICFISAMETIVQHISFSLSAAISVMP